MSTSEAVTTHSILIFCITNTVACILPSHAFCSLKEIFNNTIYAVDFSKLILSTDSLNLWLVNQCVWERMISLSKSCMPLVLLCKEQALNQTGWLFCLCLVSTGGYFRVIFHHVALWDSMFYIAYQCEKARTGTLFYHLLASCKSCQFNRVEKKNEVKAAPDMSHQIESGPPHSSDLTSSHEDDQPFISVGLWNSLKFPSQVFTPVNPSSFPRQKDKSRAKKERQQGR